MKEKLLWHALLDLLGLDYNMPILDFSLFSCIVIISTISLDAL